MTGSAMKCNEMEMDVSYLRGSGSIFLHFIFISIFSLKGGVRGGKNHWALDFVAGLADFYFSG